MQYTAESNACLLCKAFCCLICMLQGFRHSTCSVTKKAHHAEHAKGNTDTCHTAASPALQYTAESNACLLCKAFCCLICSLQGFRHSTCSVIKTAQHAEHMKGSIDTCHTAASAALQCTAESNACLFCKAFCCLFTLLQDSGTAQLQHMQ